MSQLGAALLLGRRRARAPARAARARPRRARRRRPERACSAASSALARACSADGRLARGDQRVAAVALGEHALRAALGRLAQLAVAAEPDAAVARHGDAGEAGGTADSPRRPRRSASRRRATATACARPRRVGQVARAGRRRVRRGARGAGRESPATSTRPPSAPARVEQRVAARTSATSAAPSSPPSAAATRALVARAATSSSSASGAARRPARRRRACAGTGWRRRARRRRARPRGARPRAPSRPRARRAARGLGGRLGRAPARALRVDGLGCCSATRSAACARVALERRELALQPASRSASSRPARPRAPRSARGRPRRASSSALLGAPSAASWRVAPLDALARGRSAARARARGAARCARRRSAPRRRGARAPRAARCARAAPPRPPGAARRPPRAPPAPRRAPRAPRRPRPRRQRARRGARGRCRGRAPSAPRCVWRSSRACSSAASAWRLSGRSRERASRSTSSARSRLSCVRSSLSWARRRRLRCLPRPGGLLDQQAPVARLGGDDRLDAALGDDGVHLLAQAGVREHLQHVDEAAARAVEAVLALARAVQPAHDRDLAHRQVDRAVGVVEDELDLGRRARLHAAAAAEDDVLHRLAAHGERRLLAHRPQHGVGDVGLARAVGADDDRHARAELELRAVGEGLEALEGQRPRCTAAQFLARPRRRAPARRMQRLERDPRGLLLGVLLRAARAAPDRRAADRRDDLEGAVVRRAVPRRRPRTRRSRRAAPGAPGAST